MTLKKGRPKEALCSMSLNEGGRPIVRVLIMVMVALHDVNDKQAVYVNAEHIEINALVSIDTEQD
jgi:hypothetical protein